MRPMLTALSDVQVQNLHKRYNVKGAVFRAINDVTLDFEANKIVALLGPSGSGKTTLLRLIAGLESVTDGHIFFAGMGHCLLHARAALMSAAFSCSLYCVPRICDRLYTARLCRTVSDIFHYQQ